MQLWQGQFPPPEAIERYERLLPGVFDKIVRMAEAQSAASIEGNAEARLMLQKDAARGQWLGWSVAMVAVVGAVLLALTDHPAVSAVLVAVPVMSVAIALINNVKRATEPRSPAERPEPPPID